MPKPTFADFVYAACHPFRTLRYARHHDRISYEQCRRYLPENPVVLEAGAYDGTNTREFCELWTDCKVYAFEPVPAAYGRLCRVASDFAGRVFPQALALGESAGTFEMHVSKTGAEGGEQSSSLLPPTATKEEFPFVGFLEETIEVQVVRLDEWAAGLGVPRIDFMWLDLQGVELAALKGCGSLLDTVSAIHCEVQNFALYEGAVLYSELATWLSGRGFKVAQEAIFRRGGNVLFVKK